MNGVLAGSGENEREEAGFVGRINPLLLQYFETKNLHDDSGI